MATTTLNPADLKAMTATDLKALAESKGISMAEARKSIGGKTPTKATWIALLTKKGKAPKKTTEKKTTEKKAKGEKKAPETGTPFTPSEEANTPAKLVREGLLAGHSDPDIRATLTRDFPEYGAVKIACSVYRREMKKAGLLK